jgi:hypothetical protein
MKKLPDAIKWLIVVAVLAALAALLLAVNDRASRVKMPEPDTTLGIYHSPSSSVSASAGD